MGKASTIIVNQSNTSPRKKKKTLTEDTNHEGLILRTGSSDSKSAAYQRVTFISNRANLIYEMNLSDDQLNMVNKY